MKTIAKTGLNVKAGIKAGALTVNHNGRGLKVKSAVKAGALTVNHNSAALRVKSGVRAAGGILASNHSRRILVTR